jgi:hypothetical protein
LLLSILWTLDDLGIRSFNRRDQELRMPAKYTGVFVPVVFEFYGGLKALAHSSTLEALPFVPKTAVVLYPSLALFDVPHTYLLKSRRALLAQNNLQVGGIWQKE